MTLFHCSVYKNSVHLVGQTSYFGVKELSLCHKLKYSNTYIFIKPDAINLWYFKLRLFDQAEFIVWNIKGLQHLVPKIKWLENHGLWQRLNSFTKSSRLPTQKLHQKPLFFIYKSYTIYLHNLGRLWEKNQLEQCCVCLHSYKKLF